jgi:hypothetical protein
MMHSTPRTTCAGFLDGLRKDAWAFEEIARKKVIGVSWDGRLFHVPLFCSQLSRPVNEWLRAHWPALFELEKRLPDQIDLWLMAEVVNGGPKIFRPTLEQCLALEQIAPRVPLADYVQPYAAMIVELPEEYRKLRGCTTLVPAPDGRHAPIFVMIGTPPPPANMIWIMCCF